MEKETNNKANDTNFTKDWMISTSDNPYNPWTQFHEWFVWDETNGYHTCQRLAKLSDFTDDLGDTEELLSYYDAAEKLLLYNVPGNYIRVYQPSNL